MKIRDFTEVDLKIPMLPDMELAATKTAEAMGEYLSFDEDKIDEIKLALDIANRQTPPNFISLPVQPVEK